jgi:hypothetical protein
MPNHYSNIIIARPAQDIPPIEGCAILMAWANGLHQRVRPVSSIASRDDRLAAWGHTRGEYDISPPTLIPGDCYAVQICFCTAWAAPSPELVAAAVADLEQRGMAVMTWIGLDPAEDAAVVLHINRA